jgi:hypothetical protein
MLFLGYVINYRTLLAQILLSLYLKEFTENQGNLIFDKILGDFE